MLATRPLPPAAYPPSSRRRSAAALGPVQQHGMRYDLFDAEQLKLQNFPQRLVLLEQHVVHRRPHNRESATRPKQEHPRRQQEPRPQRQQERQFQQERQPQQQQERHAEQHKTDSPTEAASPRYSKQNPPSLELQRSYGCSTLSIADLKQRIRDSRTDSSEASTQVVLDQRLPLPPTPTTPWTLNMGNKPSSITGSPVPDDRSLRSVVRGSRHSAPWKSSHNLFRRVDSRSPLHRDVTASVMPILRRDGHKMDDSGTTDDDEPMGIPKRPVGERSDRRDSRNPGMIPHVNSASTVTMTEDRACRPLSASTTVREGTSADQSGMEDAQTDGTFDTNDLPPLPPDGDALSNLSPTIPAPSPLPEDSPHKYGLRDRMDTPDVPEQPDKISIAKMRRKSSGLEIFNEAKTLQSAQSFLNGLSTSRRRAESASAMRVSATSDTMVAVGMATTRPSSARQLSSGRRSSCQDREGRRKGHNFKPSGFAYSRPLTIAQIRCYRGHARLLRSGNKHAPVECAVCHIDDDTEHFSCSFCALRLCRYCRADFAQRGLDALKERVRQAEFGGDEDSSANSSTESLHALRKCKSATCV